MKKILSMFVVASALFATIGCSGEEKKTTPTGGSGSGKNAPDTAKKDEPKKEAAK